jgi:hypothetical protein
VNISRCGKKKFTPAATSQEITNSQGNYKKQNILYYIYFYFGRGEERGRSLKKLNIKE